MAGHIQSCPSCKALLLQETIQCPQCGHVLDEQRHQQQQEAPGAQRGQVQPSAEEEACPTCGMSVRTGLVRCWNCGSFMREDIAQLYQKMQAKPAPVIYSDPPEAESSTREKPVYQFRDSDLAADDDFEVSMDVAAEMQSREEATPQPALGPEPESTTYGLRAAQPSGTEAVAANGSPAAESPPQQAAAAPPSADAAPPPQAAEAGAQGGRGEGAQESPGEHHSVATGGDVLLEVALQEEKELQKRRTQGAKRRRAALAASGLLVFCPNGHRIEVQEKHRGKTGRCPKCKAMFIVPEESAEQKPEGEAAEAAADAIGGYTRWMKDLNLHTVNPQKLRLKPGSLQKEFQEVDLAFSPENVLLLGLSKPGGLFGLGGTKKDDAREAVQTALREQTPVTDLPAATKVVYDADAVRLITIAQPIVYEHESMFVGVPVFGEGRIAVRLPKRDGDEFPQFVSFSLTQFREFASILSDLYDIKEFGYEFGIPHEDQFVELTCHYSDEKFRTLASEHIPFYRADAALKLKLVGRKCEGCGLVISEDSRKKEKIGGSSGKGIAKAKCPKCGKKFGDVSLFDLEEQAPQQEEEKDVEKGQDAARQKGDEKGRDAANGQGKGNDTDPDKKEGNNILDALC